MRSIAVKLTLAFLLVGLTGAVLVAISVRYRTQREFDRLVVDQNQQALVANLTRYYQIYGTWSGVEAVFLPPVQDSSLPLHNPDPRWNIRRSLFVIANPDGTILFGGSPEIAGRKLKSRELNKGVALQVNGETVGWLIFVPTIDRWQPGTPEGNFLLNVSQATIFSALAATAIALVVGGVLAYSLTRSLRELTTATKELASGKLGYQVKVRSNDELGELATSFNQMSSELARSNELRRKMTADIAHDLRTPLSVIMGYTEALNDGKLDPSPEMFSVMHIEALHLSRLIEDLKTLSLADAGELPLMLQSIPPEVVIKRAADTYRVKADQKGITLQVAISPDLPEITVDVERMAQVLGNLIDNALRYTPSGGEIQLSVAATGEEVRLDVKDNGSGIPAEYLPYIFERTRLGDKARQQAEGETGLGLSIAKSLVEAQGGSITVQSEVGVGTTFSIHLPLKPEVS